jgi:Arc/MetJ-type ribon-helix-helix transcriptional regulator
MSTRKQRLTVTVDPELVEAGNEAIDRGEVGSLSSWVNSALADRAAKDRRLRALKKAVESYEAEFGIISQAEMEDLQRSDGRSSVIVRGHDPLHQQG